MTKALTLEKDDEVRILTGSYKGKKGIVDQRTSNGALVIIPDVSSNGLFVYLRYQLRKLPDRKED